MPYPAGTCVTCGSQPAPNRSRCKPCLAKRREDDRLLREDRRAKHLCVTCGDPAAVDRVYCAIHLAYYARITHPAVRRAKRKKEGRA